jgi:hypothetical protein
VPLQLVHHALPRHADLLRALHLGLVGFIISKGGLSEEEEEVRWAFDTGATHGVRWTML